jgi:prepilin-type N-terminal cleavage/methylation domain-containing protein
VSSRRRRAFTLIEVLIVVTIMAILAATIIPRMSNSTTDAKESLLRHHLYGLRQQIERYKLDHRGGLPNGLINLKQLTAPTSLTGQISPTGEVNDQYPLGPYLKEIPAQPFSGSATVRRQVTSANPTFPAAPGGGWVYQVPTGRLWVDHVDYSTW